MKKILYLTFYFEPDLSACSFRNTPLIKELAKRSEGKASIDVFTTQPNRYGSFNIDATDFENNNSFDVYRIKIPKHNNGMIDQIKSFRHFYNEVQKQVRGKKYDLVVASSSRLFTAYLGYKIASQNKTPLYLDIRDIFVDTLNDVLKNRILKNMVLPVLKIIERRTFGYATHINLISEGFKSYFDSYKNASYTFYTNGIDDVFLNAASNVKSIKNSGPKKIVYAGNIGEGQGLHKIIPEAAKLLGNDYEFSIIGDGGVKALLIEEIQALGVRNVQLKDPMPRDLLILEYHQADYLFVHLNDYDAFKKVLPSKIFELAMFNKTLLVGVNGFAREFVEKNLPDSILFYPTNAVEMVSKLKQREIVGVEDIDRSKFIENFNREVINVKMAESILALIH